MFGTGCLIAGRFLIVCVQCVRGIQIIIFLHITNSVPELLKSLICKKVGNYILAIKCGEIQGLE